jgi:hypothetical protein
LTAIALGRPVTSDCLQLLLDFVDPFLNPATIGFQLRFTFAAAHSDAAALPRKVAPKARESRQQMLQLGQFHLQFSFARTGALGENIKNQRCAIKHLAAKDFLQVAALRRRKLIVEHDRIDVVLAAKLGELRGFAASNECSRYGSLEFLCAGADKRATGGGGKLAQFFERFPELPTFAGFKFQTDEEDAFGPFGRRDERFQWFANEPCDTLTHSAVSATSRRQERFRITRYESLDFAGLGRLPSRHSRTTRAKRLGG